jgi:hypothetical protein
MRATCPVCLILLDLIYLILMQETKMLLIYLKAMYGTLLRSTHVL